MFEPVASVNNQTREYVIALPAFGNYTVRLSVTNNKGLSAHTLREVEVKPPVGEWNMHKLLLYRAVDTCYFFLHVFVHKLLLSLQEKYCYITVP